MAVFKIKGGLGNQLFQFAAAYALSKKRNCNVYLDRSFFEENSLHEGYLLNLIDDYFKTVCKSKGYRLGQKFNSRLPRALQRGFFEQSLTYDASFFEKSCSGHYEGYFHSVHYFDQFRGAIARLILTAESRFSPKYQENVKKYDFSKTVALHVRRGDYTNAMNASIYDSCSIQYYYSCLEALLKKFEGQIEAVLIFTDDVDYVRENFKPGTIKAPLHIVSEQKLSAFEELVLMSKCAFIVTANSTFSWWSAYLSQNPDDRIYMPKRWFRDGRKYDLQSTNWQKVEN